MADFFTEYVTWFGVDLDGDPSEYVQVTMTRRKLRNLLLAVKIVELVKDVFFWLSQMESRRGSYMEANSKIEPLFIRIAKMMNLYQLDVNHDD